MTLKDTIEIVESIADGYGDQSVKTLTSVKCLFIQRTSMSHDAHADGVLTNAVVYLDPTNQIVLKNAYRLEGMYVIANIFAQPQNKSWYRIIAVDVGQRKLLDNTVDNIHCRLQKVEGIAYVS